MCNFFHSHRVLNYVVRFSERKEGRVTKMKNVNIREEASNQRDAFFFFFFLQFKVNHSA